MIRSTLAILVLAALFVILSGTERSAVQATDPGPAPAPLLTCGDVNADGAVAGPDFFALLGRFGTAYPEPAFTYLYDLNADSAVAGTDFFAILGDFGTFCPLADTQIALATLWAIGGLPANHPCMTNNAPPPLTESSSALSAIGYTGGGQDVPGQGKHYMKLQNWANGFDPCRPEGLVYDSGRLVAHLHYINGDVVGWNGAPPPVDNVDIDAFCVTTQYGNTPCSWSNDNGPEPLDGWHLHEDLCVINLGQPNSQLFRTQTAAECQAAAGGANWNWFERLGWMGHLWNHQLSGNGRLADCAPDPAGYFAFYGQKGVFGSHDCPQ
jgi:hypothetical protein